MPSPLRKTEILRQDQQRLAESADAAVRVNEGPLPPVNKDLNPALPSATRSCYTRWGWGNTHISLRVRVRDSFNDEILPANARCCLSPVRASNPTSGITAPELKALFRDDAVVTALRCLRHKAAGGHQSVISAVSPTGQATVEDQPVEVLDLAAACVAADMAGDLPAASANLPDTAQMDVEEDNVDLPKRD